ncbi:hypothetical protein ACWEYN_09035 [Staphylococcus xylosus]
MRRAKVDETRQARNTLNVIEQKQSPKFNRIEVIRNSIIEYCVLLKVFFKQNWNIVSNN